MANSKTMGINKYAVMYDNLKAVYGEDVDTMISVMAASKNHSSIPTSEQAVHNAATMMSESNIQKLLLLSILLSSGACSLFITLAIASGKEAILEWRRILSKS